MLRILMTENAATDQQTHRQTRQNTVDPFMILQKREIMVGFPGVHACGQAGGLLLCEVTACLAVPLGTRQIKR